MTNVISLALHRPITPARDLLSIAASPEGLAYLAITERNGDTVELAMTARELEEHVRRAEDVLDVLKGMK